MSMDYAMQYLAFNEVAMGRLNDLGLMETSEFMINPFTGKKMNSRGERQHRSTKANFLRDIVITWCHDFGRDRPESIAPFRDPVALGNWLLTAVDREFLQSEIDENPDLPNLEATLQVMGHPEVVPVARYPEGFGGIEAWFGVREWTPLTKTICNSHPKLFEKVLAPTCTWISPQVADEFASQLGLWLCREQLSEIEMQEEARYKKWCEEMGRAYRDHAYDPDEDLKKVDHCVQFFKNSASRGNYILNLCGFY